MYTKENVFLIALFKKAETMSLANEYLNEPGLQCSLAR